MVGTVRQELELQSPVLLAHSAQSRVCMTYLSVKFARLGSFVRQGRFKGPVMLDSCVKGGP